MTGFRKKILFGFYILVIGIILLYVLFPAEAVKNHLANRINQNISEVQVDIGSLRLGFPPALTLKEVNLSKNGALLASMDLLKLTPGWFSLLSNRKTFRFKGRTHQGDVSGIGWVAFENGGIEGSTSGSFSEIRLEEVPALKTQTRLNLVGTLSGSFQAEAASTIPANGNGHIFISDCNFVPSMPLMNIQQLEFQRVEGDFDFEGRSLEIKGGKLDGTEFNGTVAGNIYFDSPVSGSEMDLEIEIIPLLSSTLSEISGLTVRATGTFENPNINIIPAR